MPSNHTSHLHFYLHHISSDLTVAIMDSRKRKAVSRETNRYIVELIESKKKLKLIFSGKLALVNLHSIQFGETEQSMLPNFNHLEIITRSSGGRNSTILRTLYACG